MVDQCEGMRGSVSRYLGILAATTDRSEEAERYFEAALAMNARMGARPWHAHTRSDYARFLEARGRAGDRLRARALSDAALAGFHELGVASSAQQRAVS